MNNYLDTHKDQLDLSKVLAATFRPLVDQWFIVIEKCILTYTNEICTREDRFQSTAEAMRHFMNNNYVRVQPYPRKGDLNV